MARTKSLFGLSTLDKTNVLFVIIFTIYDPVFS